MSPATKFCPVKVIGSDAHIVLSPSLVTILRLRSCSTVIVTSVAEGVGAQIIPLAVALVSRLNEVVCTILNEPAGKLIPV